MAINFRAGLDEIGQIGESAQRGFGGIAQQVRMNKEIEAQNQRAKQQEKQQMWDTALNAASTFASVKMRNEEMSLRKEQQAQQTAIFNEQQNMKSAAALATIKDNQKEEIIPGVEGFGEEKKITEKIALPEQLKNADITSQAAYINQMKASEEARVLQAQKLEDRELNNKNITSQIASRESGDRLDRQKADLDKQKAIVDATTSVTNMITKPVKDFQDRAAKIANNSNAVYTDGVDERTLKENDKAKTSVASSAARIKVNEFAKEELYKIGGITDYKNADGTLKPLTKDMLNTIVEKVQSGDKESIARAEMLYGTLLFTAKQPGMGQISESEYAIMGGMSGAGALQHLREIAPDGNVFSNSWRKLTSDIKGRSETLQVLVDKLNNQNNDAKTDAMLAMSSTGGLGAIPKAQRDAELFKMLPEAAQRQEGALKQFSNMTIQQQAEAVFGKDMAAQMNLETASKKDYLAQNPQVALAAEADALAKSLPTGMDSPLIDKSTVQAVRQQALNTLAFYKNTERKPIEQVPGSAPVPNNGNYAVIAKEDGTIAPQFNPSGIPIFTGNRYIGPMRPLEQQLQGSQKQAQQTQSMYTPKMGSFDLEKKTQQSIASK